VRGPILFKKERKRADEEVLPGLDRAFDAFNNGKLRFSTAYAFLYRVRTRKQKTPPIGGAFLLPVQVKPVQPRILLFNILVIFYLLGMSFSVSGRLF
jgi:hypothetical protein